MNGLIQQGTVECYKVTDTFEDSIKDRLLQAQKRHSEQLGSINAALEAMDKNPEVARMMELVTKAARY